MSDDDVSDDDVTDEIGDSTGDAGDDAPQSTLRWGAATDVGRTRTENQDTFLVVPEEDLYLMADGMGGHQGGEIASALAVETVKAQYAEHTVDGLEEAVLAANDAIYSRGEAETELQGMGTTLVALARIESYGQEVLAIVNVGDSRVYRFADNELEQLTEDHSLVADLVRAGRLTPEEAEHHPQRNIVTRVLGPYETIDVDIIEVNPRTGDRFVLASDGLFGELATDQMAAVLRRLDDPDDAARELVRLANEAGGRDNITCLIVDVVDDGGRAARASAVLAAARGDMAGRATSAEGEPADLAGFSTALDEDALDAIDTAFTPDEEPEPTRRRRARGPRPRRFTWRVAVFVVLVVAVLGGAFGAVLYYGRNTYYVGLEGEDVAIFRGRPGGLLWIDPELVDTAELTLDEVPADRRAQVREGHELTSLASARRYVANLERDADDRPSSSSSTSSSTSTTSTTRPS